ncbi:hypothetical protein BKA61DRAFT_362552 [Leptodontidium sp. MPI-SDFR-AT-0119]|nr:hypothetical protein BKA61DRAFT_362552 [Leptodontidium sp. MPI-SDFR-AT-0119]
MIWEHTWPAFRIMEAAICEDETTAEDEYIDAAVLRFARSLSVFLEEDFGSTIVEGQPLERCPPPVTLQVCKESRKHTLSQYRVMEHTNSKLGSFCFNPSRDILWFQFRLHRRPWASSRSRALLWRAA